MAHLKDNGFTLIELSIVLVIIGLIIGGVLVGRDLIDAARIRQQISQIEQYNTAVHTFQSKYNCLPGDCANAADFGFPARGQYAGEGDGNGVLEGVWSNNPGDNAGFWEGAGETVLFWEDLSQASLIESSFTTGNAHDTAPARINITGTGLDAYYPHGKLSTTYVFVYSGSAANSADGINYYGLTAISYVSANGNMAPNMGISVSQAYSIDTKIDDGMPYSGNVTTTIPIWGGALFVGNDGGPLTEPISPSATTCVDNGGSNSGLPQRYSMSVNNGSGLNCALSFKFQ